ncbi:MAG: OprO/OprP family phosphate-selective porin [Gemmatimonadota bacterium]|nr:OprO/OprP family phosphate-selective porin [Gemmatimonadota bacterium]
MHRTPVLLLAALPLAAPTTLAAQLRLPDGVTGTLSGRFQMQFNSTSVDSLSGTRVPETEMRIRRARLTFDVTFNDLLSARIEPDYGSSGFSLKDAYVRLSFSPAFRATLGQFKRPFDLFELTSSTRILVVERAGTIRGVEACGGIESVCALSAFTEELGYSDRDVGVLLDGDAGGVLHWAASLTNGEGQNKQESNGNKQYTGRVSVEPVKDVVVSANASVKDYAHPTTGAQAFANAFGGDVEIGNSSRGVHVQAGIVAGDNWAVPAGLEEVASFLTGQAIVTYKAPLAHKYVTGVEPVARATWGDPNTDADDDAGWLLTPGMIVHFGGRNVLYLNLDVWLPSTGTNEYSFKTQMNFHF